MRKIRKKPNLSATVQNCNPIFLLIIFGGSNSQGCFHKCEHFWAKSYYQFGYTHTPPLLYVHLSTVFKGTVTRDFLGLFYIVGKIGPELCCVRVFETLHRLFNRIYPQLIRNPHRLILYYKNVMHLFSHALWQETIVSNQSECHKVLI